MRYHEYMIVVGIDEVGRGCWAGPLVAGAVVLDKPIPGLRDSKKLSKKQREILAPLIHEQALAVGIGWVTPEELDASGITTAVKVAIERALAELRSNYGEEREMFDAVIIDGNINYLPEEPLAEAVIKADDTVPAVSAASIVAKVARDQYMEHIALEYPAYGFEKHVGYGTAAHIAALGEYGVTMLHRQSFAPIRKLIEARA